LVGSTVNFSWTFSGDVRTVTWGLKKESVTNSFDTNGKLVSLNEASIMLPLSIPLSHNGRVSGGRTFNLSSGKAIFTLNNGMKDDEKFYLCEIDPNDPNDSPHYDFVYLAIEGEYKIMAGFLGQRTQRNKEKKHTYSVLPASL